MGLFDKLDNFLIDKDYKVVIERDKIHIINYLEIVDFSSNLLKVRYIDGVNVFLGRDLVVSKMLDDELIVVGKLDSIEYK